MDRQKIVVLSLVLLCSLVAAGVAWADGTPTISWWVIGGGGGHLEMSPYILDGTIGQSVVGWVANSPYELCAGFWCQAAAQYHIFLPLVLRLYVATGKAWNRRRVESIRKKHKIPTACPYHTRVEGPRGDGLIAAPEAAARLGVDSSMISYWFRRGLLEGHQRDHQALVWVRLTEDDIPRFDDFADLKPDMVYLTDAPQVLGITNEQMREEIRAGRLITYRLKDGKRWRWYVQIPADPITHADES